MKLADFLEAAAVIPELSSNSKEEVINELSESISEKYSNINNDRLVEALVEREKLCSTAVDFGVAVPHAKLSGISDIVIGFGRSLEGIDYESLDEKPTHFFITLIAPEEAAGVHIQLLARISKVFKEPEFRSRLMKCESGEEIHESIITEDDKY